VKDSRNNMNLTVELLRVLDSPFEVFTVPVSQSKVVKLCKVSEKNRMLFFYLHKIGMKNLGNLVSLYKKEHKHYIKTNDAIAQVSQILKNANIEHAFFKTIRPYKSTTVDLDILVFGERKGYMKSEKAMERAGYKLVAHGPRSITFWDQEANIGIDLYEQIAVSFITYIDKRKLRHYVRDIILPNGKCVRTLKPEADLACIIAHSLIKEQMYTLSEYYTFIYYLKEMNIGNFLQVVKQNNITTATRTHAAITALLHETAHGTIPNGLQQIISHLGEENFEMLRAIRNNFETPRKYHPITITRSLLEITKGIETRKSVATQILKSLNPSFSIDFLRKFIDHAFRKTY